MHPRRGSPRLMVLSLAALAAALPPPPGAAGDSWEEPKNRKVRSPDGRHTALVIPRPLGRDAPAGRALPRVHIYEGEPGEGGEWSTLWSVALTNRTAPVQVLLTSDARHLVTLDEWHSVGRGEDTVAFYRRDGDGEGGRQLARYSLEQLLTREERAGLPMSVSSTWWREHGHTFLDEAEVNEGAPDEDGAEQEGDGADDGGDEGRAYLCAWLGTCGRWLAWDVSTGLPVEPEGEPLRRWNEQAREWALTQLAADPSGGGDFVGATRFLAVLKDPRDRPALEGALRAEDFQARWGPLADRGEGLGLCEVESSTRQAADRALAIWDGRPFAEVTAERDVWPYARAGNLEVSVRLSAAPEEGGQARGGLFVYLIPEEVEEARWAQSRPAHRAEAGLPHGLDAGRFPGAVTVRFRGVTPGRYWVKAVYDRAAPFHDDDDERDDAAAAAGGVCEAGPGDHQTLGRGRVIEVEPGANAVADDELTCVDG